MSIKKCDKKPDDLIKLQMSIPFWLAEKFKKSSKKQGLYLDKSLQVAMIMFINEDK